MYIIHVYLKLHLSYDFGIFCLPPAPSAPVIMDAVNTSSTSIRVTWAPPLFRNGIIRQYIITYYITSEGPSASDSMAVAMSDATMAEVIGLMIFTNYSISVMAETVEPGDPSETVTVTTDEDREF